MPILRALLSPFALLGVAVILALAAVAALVAGLLIAPWYSLREKKLAHDSTVPLTEKFN